jgi:hypothetical protein
MVALAIEGLCPPELSPAVGAAGDVGNSTLSSDLGADSVRETLSASSSLYNFCRAPLSSRPNASVR